MKTRLRKISQSHLFLPLVSLLLVLLFNLIYTGGEFFRISVLNGHLYGRIIDILKNGTPLALLAVGMTMVIATGGTDISVGSVIAISGALACSIIDGRLGLWNGSVVGAVAVALTAGVLCGAWNGLLVSKVKLQPIVATMILLTAGRGIAQLITDGKIVTINNLFYYAIGAGYFLGLPIPMYLLAFLMTAVLLFVKKTAFGLFLESVGVNAEASAFSGVKSDRVKLIVYTVSGLCAGIAGVIISAGIKSADCNNAGLYIEMDAILAVALGGNSMAGGKFSIPASVIGAFVLQALTTTILALGVPSETTRVVKAVVVILICLIQSPAFRAVFVRLFRRLRGPSMEGSVQA
ncbi:MAG: ABC transporter permease [Clostridia bacterium]|nr:ABC transporter permease [Clostridia bacterium]